MDGMDRSSSLSSSKISGGKRRLNFGGDVHQLNESLFELYKPSGKPRLQILFFHGFQIGDYDNAHASTWESEDEDGTFIWPQTWLSEEFPEAHILSIAYNCRMKESREYGSADLFILGENLMADLLAENIGQDRRCPVVLVGHSFGGLVTKKLCLIARDESRTGSTKHSKFLDNVTGLFFYSTPHGGINSKEVPPLFESKSLLLKSVESLSKSTSRLNDEFEKLRHFYNWRIAGVGESCETEWEASSRYHGDYLFVNGANHITISEPREKISTTFTVLTNFIHEVSAARKVGGVIHQTHGLPDFPFGLDEHVEDVKKKLEMAPSPVKVLGIVGMGGIGKTTIAKQLFNDISSKYEYTCFVDNVKGIPIYELEDWLLTHFHCDGQHLSKIQWSSLKDKTTLIVMDDVDSEDQLKKLPKLDYFLGGSNVIITSRDHNVSTNVYQNCVLYDVEFLTPDHAKKLLCQHVFDMDTIKRDHCLAHLVDEVVRKCQGLPLTLEVMGRYLRQNRTNASFWKETIRKLGETQPIDGRENDKVWHSLKLSYEHLQQEEQQMFIEAATCFFEQPLEEALAAWTTPCGCAEMVWENLIRKSLVKVVTKRMFDLYDIWGDFANDYEEIWVHEECRDFAKNMSQRSQTHWVLKNPYHALLMAHNMIKASGDDDDHEDDDHDNDHEDDDYQDNEEGSPIEHLLSYNQYRLELLEDHDYQDHEVGSLIEPLLSYNQPPTTVQSELLEDDDDHEDDDFQDNEERSPMEPLLSYNQPPTTVQSELLEDDDDHEDDDFQDNEERSPMEPLLSYNQPPTTVQSELLEDDDDHEDDDYLDNEEGSLMEPLLSYNQPPTTVQSELLEDDDDDYLDNEERSLMEPLLSYNQPPTTLRLELLENLEDVKYLYLDNIMLQDFKGNFPRNISLLKWILSEDLGRPKLPEINWKDLINLGLLHLEGWSISREFIEALGTLTNLRILKLDCLPGFDRLPRDIGNLSSLKELRLWNLQLSALPESFGDLEALEQLGLCRLGISQLPESIGRCHSLERVSINWCHSLRSLPESFGGLCSLEKLSITGCESVGSLPDNFGQLKALKTLTLKDCPKLQSFPDTFGELKALERLILENCPKLQSLPHNYPELKRLSIISL